MTDTTEIVEPGTTEEQAAAVREMQPADVAKQAAENVQGAEATAAAKGKPAKVKAAPKACACRRFEVGEEWEENGQPMRGDDTTGCEQTTLSTFAQGHDAKLVSFLVQAELDGNTIWSTDGGLLITHGGAESAAATISAPLAAKAKAALERGVAASNTRKEREALKDTARKAKAAAKAAAKVEKERKAAETKAAKDAKTAKPQAEVVAGSQEGDTPQPREGLSSIKVGRWTYDDAVIDPQTGVASYRDGKGELHEVEQDGYRLLNPTADWS